MAARSIASLTVSFGLVAIPVKLYSATESSGTVRFNLLHGKDGSRLKQQYVCVKDGKVVERDEIVKGYEFAKDQYVMFTPEEIQALEETGSHSIEVSEFVPLDSIDPVYFDRTYYLAPDKGGGKPYTLFATALRESGRAAVGRWATRGKDHIVIVRPMENGLALHQLHFGTEVRSIKELGVEESAVKDAELKLARQLIDSQTTERFEPGQYTDQVKARIEAQIQKKIEGQEISVSSPRPEAPNVIDLMEALRASLGKSGGAKPAPAARVQAAPAPATQIGARKPPKQAQKKTAGARKTTRG
jgi:DNA end-binding protein Ku